MTISKSLTQKTYLTSVICLKIKVYHIPNISKSKNLLLKRYILPILPAYKPNFKIARRGCGLHFFFHLLSSSVFVRNFSSIQAGKNATSSIRRPTKKLFEDLLVTIRPRTERVLRWMVWKFVAPGASSLFPKRTITSRTTSLCSSAATRQLKSAF